MRQYRYAANDFLWELPAGTLNGRLQDGRVLPTESPEACARRELLEEIGYEAAKMEKVCECFAMPGTSDEFMHIFFASGLSKRTQSLDVGEIIVEIRPMSLGEVKRMIDRREIRDAKMLLGLFYALQRGAQPS
jgi:ADP-ribose pyrophosphatase